MGRQSGAILILSALVAFFLPLVGRAVWQQYQQLLNPSSPQPVMAAQSRTMRPPPPAKRTVPTPVARAVTVRPSAEADGNDRVSLASYTTDRPGLFPGYDARDTRIHATNGMALPPDSPASAQADSGNRAADPLLRLKSTLVKLGFVSVALVLVCLACFRFGQPLGMSRQTQRQLHVEDSIALSREAGVKLITVGDQKFVVGHDRRGLQSLVLLPQRFDEVFRGELRDGGADEPTAANVAESIRTSLTKPEDDGWDLIRRTS